MKTIFCDVDGVILNQPESFLDLYKKIIMNPYGEVIPNSRDKLFNWYIKGYRIILTTGRPEHEHPAMSKYLADNGIYFHKLIMECGADQRFLINDINPFEPSIMKAVAINITRNTGLDDISEV